MTLHPYKYFATQRKQCKKGFYSIHAVGVVGTTIYEIYREGGRTLEAKTLATFDNEFIGGIQTKLRQFGVVSILTNHRHIIRDNINLIKI